MKTKKQRQLNQISDEVLALTAVVRPILVDVLYSIKGDTVAEPRDLDGFKLKMLPHLRRTGEGCEACFEYAIHSPINNNGNPKVIERIVDTSKLCKLKGKNPDSILFDSGHPIDQITQERWSSGENTCGS